MTTINQADRIYLGSVQVSAVYAGANKVWPFKPTNLAGCAIWLDASSLQLPGGITPVTAWPNLGIGPQPTMFGSPPMSRVTTDYSLLPFPVVRITSGQGQLSFTGTGVDKDYTLVYVARRWRLTPGRVVAANMTISGSNILWGFHGAEYDCAYAEGWFNTPGPVGGIPATTAWRLYSGESSATGTARLFSNGVYLGSHPTPPPSKGFGGTLCITGWSSDRSQESDADIAEFVMYNRRLSDAERGTIEGYMRTKWGIT
jgi:hypothetical protein